MWGTIAASVMTFYIIPFYLKDPTILNKGIAYHNSCAISEWRGFGPEHASNTFAPGIYFGSYFKNLLPGNAEQKVYAMRTIQAGIMLLLNIAGLWYYQRNKHRIDYSFFTLLMLFVFLLFFYMFSPLLYKYYHLVTLSVSAILCGAIMLSRNRETTP